MQKQLTVTEISKIQNLCFSNPIKSCAIAQLIVDTCQIVSCTTFADVKEKSRRTINYKAESLVGLKIENRYYISINQ